ncbi:MAG TPA: ATP-binding cassette domain-containing protein, partial [Anaerolineales bacterium]|nr:ATP-binding cassette domain-containing protein [Anaerolineales bacterium]
RVGDKQILLETGKVAKQAHGAVMVRLGDSIVLVTVVSAAERKEGIDFFPLTVDYQEKMFAAGKIPGSLGISGLMGAGRSELGRAIFGADRIDAGEVIMNGRKLSLNSPADAIKAGIAYLSENRKEDGLAVKMQLAENITMANVQEISRRFGVLSRNLEMEAAQRYVKDLTIRTPSISQIVNNLSGGNQQKVVVAKWLFCDSKILIFDEPTRGIDVGTKYAIYELIGALARDGRGIIVISSELPEILGLTDRLLVLHEGNLAATLTTAKTTQEEILSYAAGIATAIAGNTHA